MSSTYTAYDAFEYAERFISGQDLDRFLPRILDDVHRILWMYAPWRWTLDLFPQFSLVSNTQDYTVTLPSDFLFLQEAKIADGKNIIHLHCGATFPATVNLISGAPSQISIQTVGSNSVARIFPCPGQFPVGAMAQKLIAIYKKNAPKVDRETAQEAGYILLPDEYFWVYLEGVLWRAMKWAQDPRAGSVTVQDDKVVYTGQLAEFQAAMLQMANMEKLNKVDSQQEQR